MPSVTVDLDPGRFSRVPKQLLPYALETAGSARAEKLRRDVSTPYPPASAPNTPPHRRTGRLRDSIGFEVVGERGDAILRVGATAPYASFLEKGTSHMQARPFLSPRLALELREMAVGVFSSLANAFTGLGWGKRP